jgi:hypothetical protein
MQNIHIGPTIREHRMSDPERGQGTLAGGTSIGLYLFGPHSTPKVSHCDLYTHRNPMLVRLPCFSSIFQGTFCVRSDQTVNAVGTK